MSFSKLCGNSHRTARTWDKAHLLNSACSKQMPVTEQAESITSMREQV